MKKGIIAGNFDVIHPGYIKMFNETIKYCDQLFVALHVDPSLERPEKIKPILSVEDRIEILLSLNSIYYVVPYSNEEELFLYLKENDWEEPGEWMWENRDHYNGLSVLPYDGGTYTQAPFEDITKRKYDEMTKTLHDVNLSKIIETEDNTDLSGELACAGGSCEVT